MKIIDFILKSLARTVVLRWQAGLATVLYDWPSEVTTLADLSSEYFRT